MLELWDHPDEDKLGELILYIADRLLDDPAGGATKLNKVLYFAEFSHIRSHGVPITGAAYQKLERGPAPRQLKPIRKALIDRGDAELRTDSYFGRPLHRLVPLRKVRSEALSDTERASVDEVVVALKGKTAAQVSDMSHDEVGWKMVQENEDIPLSTAYLPNRAVMSEAARLRGKELAASLHSPA